MDVVFFLNCLQFFIIAFKFKNISSINFNFQDTQQFLMNEIS